MSASIIGPSGTPFVNLGGDRAWIQRTHGDIVCSLQWLDLWAQGDETAQRAQQPEPCLVLFSALRRINAGAYVIPQRNAHMFAQSDGRPTHHLIQAAVGAAEQMGFDRNDRNVIYRVVDVIVEAIPDLIRMSSTQPAALDIVRPVRGIEASVSVNGKTILEGVS